MAELTERPAFTQVVEFEVEPDKQELLIAAIVAELERWIRHRPGFISSTLHASFDGRRVLNYAQWRSKADFHAFTQDPEGERAKRGHSRRWAEQRPARHCLPRCAQHRLDVNG